MEHLNKTMTRVDDKVLGEENANNLKAALADLKDASASFKASAKNVEESSKRLGPMFDKLDPAIGKVDKVMTTADDSLQSIKKAADSFAIAAKNITTGKGLLGALTNDAELKTEFKDLISNLKRNGVIFYKNSADKQRTESTPTKTAPAPEPSAGLKPIFGR
jgi:ABC-type transporter Mla subunit MlaD